jgi:hypothetical protein
MKRTNPNTRKFTRARSRRTRPLTAAQEILFIATAVVAGGMLQMLVILHIGGILD